MLPRSHGLRGAKLDCQGAKGILCCAKVSQLFFPLELASLLRSVVTQHLREDSRDGMRLTQGASVRVEGHEQALQKRAATLARKVHTHDADGQQEEAHVHQLFSVTNGGQKRAR